MPLTITNFISQIPGTNYRKSVQCNIIYVKLRTTKTGQYVCWTYTFKCTV